MDEPHQRLQPHAPLVPTGIRTELDEAIGSIRSGRPTRQGHQRIGHAHQTPMCSKGFGAPQAGRGEAQRPLAVLSARFRGQRCQDRRMLLAALQAAQVVTHTTARPVRGSVSTRTTMRPWRRHAAPQRQALVGVRSDVQRARGVGREQRPQRLDRALGAWPLPRPAVGVPPVHARRCQQTVLFEPANPGFPPPRRDPDHVLRQRPGVKDHPATGHGAPHGRVHPCDREVLEPGGIDLLMPAIPRLGRGRDRQGWNGLGHRRFPPGQGSIPTRAAQAQGAAHRPLTWTLVTE